MIAGLGGLMTAALAAPAAAYLLFKPRSVRKDDFVQAGDLAQFTVGKPEEVLYNRTVVDGWRAFEQKSVAWVVRQDDKNVVAFTPECTHLACGYHWDDKESHFVCPCHGSVFAIDGKVLAGPAPRPLDRYVTKIDGGKLLIGSEIQRASD